LLRRSSPGTSLFRRKRLWLLAIAACLLVIGLNGPLKFLFDRNALVAYFNLLGHWSIGIFIGAHVLTTALGLPASVLVITGGAVFGLVWGTIWSVIGATLGAIAAFFMARHLFHDLLEQRFRRNKMLAQCNEMVCSQNALQYVLIVRFAPISPFTIMNFLFGLTAMKLKPYALGTFLGIIPGTLAYTWLGVTGIQALEGGAIAPLLISITCLILLSLTPIILNRRSWHE